MTRVALRVEELTSPLPVFEISQAREAHEPAEVRGHGRDDVALLVTRGPSGEPSHARFRDLPEHLERGDLVVLNASATVPSRLTAQAPDGSAYALHVSTRLTGDVCVVEPREHAAHAGEVARLAGGASAEFIAQHRGSHRLWIVHLHGVGDVIRYLYRWGTPIAYRHVREAWPAEVYQNVYASVAGSAEMPSAGRPFTREMFARLRMRGIRTAFILLHTGVSSAERDEPPYEERFRVSRDTAERIARTRAAGRRVVAVGTTVVRAVESASSAPGRIAPAAGWTDLVITPERGLYNVDAMITGLHEPRSTHLAMLEALAGRRHLGRAYDTALKGGYLWHEFGDSHLLVP